MATEAELQRILNSIVHQLNLLDQMVENMVDYMDTTLTIGAEAITIAAANAEERLFTSIDASVAVIESTTVDSLNVITDTAVSGIEIIAATSLAFLTQTQALTVAALDSIALSLQNVEGHVSDLLSAGEEILLFQVNSATQHLEDALEELLVPLTTSANAFFVMARDTPVAIGFLGGQIAAAIGELPEENREAISEPIAAALNQLAEALSGTMVTDPQDLLRASLNAIAGATPQPSDVIAARTIATLSPQGPAAVAPMGPGDSGGLLPVAKGIANTLATALAVGLSILGVAAAQAEPAIRAVSQQANDAWRNALPDPGTLAVGFKRKIISQDEYRANMAQLGFGPQATESYLQTSEQEIGIIDAIALWHRGINDTETTIDLLERGGSSTLSAHLLLELGNVLPPVPDLVRMAVREVYSPEIAEQFGIFEEFPEQFIHEAAKQGLSEETARQYWGAHWDLPSPNMGFEMFHRRIINEDTLNLLMRALDIMPFWRDKLVALAYNPLTRVDVRRMHALGVLDDEGVTSAYLDLGYSPENAARMTEFTLRYNAETSTLGSEQQRELTVAQLLRLFRDGLTSETDTISNLVGLGYSGDDAEILVTREVIQVELDQRDDEKRAIIEMVKAGNLDFIQAQADLARLGFSQAEIEIIINRLEREMATKVKAPSEEKLVALFKKRVINPDELRESLSLLGYPNFWVSRLMRLYTGSV